MAIELSTLEEEVIFLKAIIEIIDSMVNFEVLELNGDDPDANISFNSMTHQAYFNIILVDFLSRTDKRASTKPKAYLEALREISQNPSFDVNSSITSLKKATREFVDWLRQEVDVEVWLPSIDTETILNLPRVEFLKMCGDISKHNFLRAIGVAKNLQGFLSKSGVSVGQDDALLALSDFYQRFHDDIFNW